jgi:hypothetical protein
MRIFFINCLVLFQANTPSNIQVCHYDHTQLRELPTTYLFGQSLHKVLHPEKRPKHTSLTSTYRTSFTRQVLLSIFYLFVLLVLCIKLVALVVGESSNAF